MFPLVFNSCVEVFLMAEMDHADQSRSLADTIGARRKALSINEFADLLSLAPTTVYEMAKSGRLPCFRIGSTIRLDPKTTADWLRKNAH
jgi:excisionase family DNA binding protein